MTINRGCVYNCRQNSHTIFQSIMLDALFDQKKKVFQRLFLILETKSPYNTVCDMPWCRSVLTPTLYLYGLL